MRRLHHFPLSPRCRQIRLILAEKRLEVELVEETPWERRIDFLRLNPAGETPVLVEGGVAVAEATSILEYLEETAPTPPMLPATPAARAEVRRLVAWFDRKMDQEATQNLIGERVIKKLMGGGQPDSARVMAGARNVKVHLEYIGWLADQRSWLAGDALTAADFAAAGHVSALDYIDAIDWASFPSAKAWYARIKSRPAFRTVLSDHVPGFPPPAQYADLDF